MNSEIKSLIHQWFILYPTDNILRAVKQKLVNNLISCSQRPFDKAAVSVPSIILKVKKRPAIKIYSWDVPVFPCFLWDLSISLSHFFIFLEGAGFIFIKSSSNFYFISWGYYFILEVNEILLWKYKHMLDLSFGN